MATTKELLNEQQRINDKIKAKSAPPKQGVTKRKPRQKPSTGSK